VLNRQGAQGSWLNPNETRRRPRPEHDDPDDDDDDGGDDEDAGADESVQHSLPSNDRTDQPEPSSDYAPQVPPAPGSPPVARRPVADHVLGQDQEPVPLPVPSGPADDFAPGQNVTVSGSAEALRALFGGLSGGSAPSKMPLPKLDVFDPKSDDVEEWWARWYACQQALNTPASRMSAGLGPFLTGKVLDVVMNNLPISDDGTRTSVADAELSLVQDILFKQYGNPLQSRQYALRLHNVRQGNKTGRQ